MKPETYKKKRPRDIKNTNKIKKDNMCVVEKFYVDVCTHVTCYSLLPVHAVNRSGKRETTQKKKLIFYANVSSSRRYSPTSACRSTT